MNSRILLIKNKLKKYLRKKEILDIIVFGSAVKGKALPNDIDIVVISELGVEGRAGLDVDVEGFHISFLKPIDFIVNPPSIVHTLFREGYSLKRDKAFSKIYKFSNGVLFRYELVGLSSSLKVKIVNLLKGKSGGKGMVDENNGEWISNQVFVIPVENEHLFERFFMNFKIKYKKFYVLMH